MHNKSSSLPCPLAAAVASVFSQALAILDNRSYTYVSFSRAVSRCKATLEAQGLSKGKRVLLLGAPSSEYCVVLWALFHSGAIACPLNPALPVEAIKNIVVRLRPECLIHDETMKDTLNPVPAPRLSFESLGERMRACAQVSLSPVLDANLPATIIMTSGSMGTFKAAVHSLDNHISAAQAANSNMPLVPGDVWLLSLPLFHVSGLAILFRCALAGATVAVACREKAVEEEMERTGATHASLVPTQLRRLLESEKGPRVVQKMKGVLLGGAPMDNGLVARARETGVPLARSYGMTETSAQICATLPGASLDDLYSSGRPLIPDTVRIAPDGCVEVRGRTLFLGYYREKA